MALPARGTLGQIVAYNGYNYKWTGTSWLNIGVATTTTGNTTSGTAVTANGVSTGNTTTNTAITANGVSTGNTTVNTAITANGVTTGNTTTGTAVSPTGVTTGNTTVNTSITANGVSTGNTTAATSVSPTGVSTGNTTVNTSISANGLSTGNTTTSTAITSSGLSTGNTTTNTSVTASVISSTNGTTTTAVTSGGVSSTNGTTTTAVTSSGLSTGNTTTATAVTSTGVSTGNTVVNTNISSAGVSTSNTTTSTAVTTSGVSTGNTVTNTRVTSTSITTSNTTTSTAVTTSGVSTGNSVTNVTINSTAVAIGTATINSSAYTGTANNALHLGGIPAADYITRDGNQTIGGVYTYTNVLNANVANFAGDVVISNNLTVTGSLTFTGVSSIVDTQDVSVSNSVISLHSPAGLAPLDADDGRLIGLAYHYYDTEDKQALLAINQSNAFLTYYKTSTDIIDGDPAGIALGTIQAATFHAGNNIVYSTVNATSYSGTANNTLYVGSTPAANIATTAQTDLLASKTSVTANAATAYANAVTYIDTAISGLGGGGDTAYANMIAYINNLDLVNTAQLSSNIGSLNVTQEFVADIAISYANDAYANALSFISAQPFVYTADIVNLPTIQQVDAAYTNAIAQTAVYIDGLLLVNTSQLEANLATVPNSAYVVETAYTAANEAYANAITYIDSQTSLATTEAIIANAATAYANSIEYINSQGYVNFSELNLVLNDYTSLNDINSQQFINSTSIDTYYFVNTSQLEANLAAVPNSAYVVETAYTAADEAYANALVYIDSQTSLATTDAIIGNSAAAYANAIDYVSSQGYVNFSELNLVLNNYANISSVQAASQSAADAYTNAVAYTDFVALSFSNSQFIVDTAYTAADQAYANALVYIDSQTSLATTDAIIGNAATAYANAVSYIDSQGYVGFSDLNLVLNGYADITSVEAASQSAVNAYANAIAYVDTALLDYPNTAYVVDTAFTAADQAYANAVIYVDAATGGATSEAIIANAAAAYANSVDYTDSRGFITNSQLTTTLSDYSTSAEVSNYVSGLNYANSDQVSAIVEGYDYVNQTTLENTLINYPTTEYVVTILENSLTYVTDQAYANAIAYTDGQSFVNSEQLAANLTNYTSVSILPLISANAATAYTNATVYVDGKSYVNTTQLTAAIATVVNSTANYTFTGVHTHNANLVINRTVIINGDAGLPGQVLTSNGSSNTIYWSTPAAGGSGSGGIFDGGTPFSTFTNGPILDAGGVL